MIYSRCEIIGEAPLSLSFPLQNVESKIYFFSLRVSRIKEIKVYIPHKLNCIMSIKVITIDLLKGMKIYYILKYNNQMIPPED